MPCVIAPPFYLGGVQALTRHLLAIVEAIKNANRKLELQAYWMEYEYELKEHGFSGEEDYILKLTDMPFEEMFRISKMPEDAFDVHAGAFETATMHI